MDFDRGWALVGIDDPGKAEKALDALAREAGERQWWKKGDFVITRIDLVVPANAPDRSPPYRLFVAVKAERGKLGTAFVFIKKFLEERGINQPPTVSGFVAGKSYGFDW